MTLACKERAILDVLWASILTALIQTVWHFILSHRESMSELSKLRTNGINQKVSTVYKQYEIGSAVA